MAVSQVIRIQAAPGRFAEVLEHSQKLQKIRERLAPGVKTRRFVPASGSMAGSTLIVVLEFEGWKQFGEFRARLQDDPESRALLQQTRASRDPFSISQTFELVQEL